jgi:hypothetical protein
MPLLCEPNDAVRAVAVAKRREYFKQLISTHIIFDVDGDMVVFVRVTLESS